MTTLTRGAVQSRSVTTAVRSLTGIAELPDRSIGLHQFRVPRQYGPDGAVPGTVPTRALFSGVGDFEDENVVLPVQQSVLVFCHHEGEPMHSGVQQIRGHVTDESEQSGGERLAQPWSGFDRR